MQIFKPGSSSIHVKLVKPESHLWFPELGLVFRCLRNEKKDCWAVSINKEGFVPDGPMFFISGYFLLNNKREKIISLYDKRVIKLRLVSPHEEAFFWAQNVSELHYYKDGAERNSRSLKDTDPNAVALSLGTTLYDEGGSKSSWVNLRRTDDHNRDRYGMCKGVYCYGSRRDCWHCKKSVGLKSMRVEINTTGLPSHSAFTVIHPVQAWIDMAGTMYDRFSVMEYDAQNRQVKSRTGHEIYIDYSQLTVMEFSLEGGALWEWLRFGYEPPQKLVLEPAQNPKFIQVKGGVSKSDYFSANTYLWAGWQLSLEEPDAQVKQISRDLTKIQNKRYKKNTKASNQVTTEKDFVMSNESWADQVEHDGTSQVKVSEDNSLANAWKGVRNESVSNKPLPEAMDKDFPSISLKGDQPVMSDEATTASRLIGVSRQFDPSVFTDKLERITGKLDTVERYIIAISRLSDINQPMTVNENYEVIQRYKPPRFQYDQNVLEETLGPKFSELKDEIGKLSYNVGLMEETIRNRCDGLQAQMMQNHQEVMDAINLKVPSYSAIAQGQASAHQTERAQVNKAITPTVSDTGSDHSDAGLNETQLSTMKKNISRLSRGANTSLGPNTPVLTIESATPSSNTAEREDENKARGGTSTEGEGS